jgi:crossover junction endodeoxyribonuclease RuvC
VTYIGVDPGASGGLVALDAGGHFVSAIPMPYDGKRVQGAEVAKWVKQFPEVRIAAIELVGAMPGNGGVSMFNFGHNTGVVTGVMQSYMIPLIQVRPQAWKKEILQGMTHDKDGARAFVAAKWPIGEWRLPRCRLIHDGMADAGCLAEYARRQHLQIGAPL